MKAVTSRGKSRWAVTVLEVGNEREPVVIVDRASGDPGSLVDYAAERSRFAPAETVGSGYPGLLGPVATTYADWLVRFTLPLVALHIAGVEVRPRRVRANYSLVTTPSGALTPEQCMPHVDTADRMQFAAIHFLSSGNSDGTGFFRHATTGFETIDAARLPTYAAALTSEPPPSTPRYPDGSDPRFRLLEAVPARFDRLVLYRAALLHSGLIREVPEEPADPRRGRLTGNLFMQCEPA